MLTQLTTIKTRLAIPAYETEFEPVLLQFLQHASARFELECRRRFARDATATYTFGALSRLICADRYPIESVAKFELKTSEDEGWVEQSEVEYLLSPARAVIALASPLGTPGELGRVTFAGGYVLPGTSPQTGQEPLPAELEYSCVEQVAYWFENRNRLGLVSAGGGGGAVQLLQDLQLLPGNTSEKVTGSAWFKFTQVDLLPGVQAVLARYRRMEGLT
ncbi:MAG: hypothetical protein WCO56_06475 [Verrucomicrobiota bacterium]